MRLIRVPIVSDLETLRVVGHAKAWSTSGTTTGITHVIHGLIRCYLPRGVRVEGSQVVYRDAGYGNEEP